MSMEPQFNAYASPNTAARPLEVPELSRPASLGQRIVNFVVDWVAILGLALGVGMVESATGAELGEGFAPWVAYGLGFLYFTLCEGLTGRTLGKVVSGTKVLDLGGRRIGLEAAALRSLCRFIPFEPFSVLILRGEGWHDTIPKTQVVRAR